MKTIVLQLLFIPTALAACSAFADSEPLSREEILRELWRPLHDLHGSSKDVAYAAEQMERERGIPRSEIVDALLESALNESTDHLQRKRSIGGFAKSRRRANGNVFHRCMPLRMSMFVF